MTVMDTSKECIQQREERLARQRQRPTIDWKEWDMKLAIYNYSMETSNNLKQLGTFYLEMGSLHFVTYLNLSISIWHGRKYYGMFMWFEIPKTFSTENNMIQIIELL